jgi:hypothetical protein
MFGCEFDELLAALYNGRREVDEEVLGLYVQVRMAGGDNPTNRMKCLYLKDAIAVATGEDGVSVRGGIPAAVLDEIRLALAELRDGRIPWVEARPWLELLESVEPVCGEELELLDELRAVLASLQER